MTAATVRLALNLSQSILSCCLAFWSSAAARPIAKVAAAGSTRGADAVECVDGVVASVSDDGAAVTPRRPRPGGLGAGPGAGAAGAGGEEEGHHGEDGDNAEDEDGPLELVEHCGAEG